MSFKYLFLFIVFHFFSGIAPIYGASTGIVVSVPPLSEMVTAIGPKGLSVHTLLGPSQNPTTFEPTPRQMANLTSANVFFRTGLPFETRLVDKIIKIHPRLEIIDLRKNLKLLEHNHSSHSHSNAETDPHIWTSPKNVLKISKRIKDVLTKNFPNSVDEIKKNYEDYRRKLFELDQLISKQLAPYSGRSFLVFHPSWSYFSETYGLKQISIEFEGKSPSPRRVSEIIRKAKKNKITVVFSQRQFDQRPASVIAKEINAKVVELDPLDRNYIKSMKKVSQKLTEAFETK